MCYGSLCLSVDFLVYVCCFDWFDLTAQEGMCCLGSLPVISFR
jgi:hypothetical protein